MRTEADWRKDGEAKMKLMQSTHLCDEEAKICGADGDSHLHQVVPEVGEMGR